MTATDPFELRRFLAAQDGIHAVALGELRSGRKKTHWMWFVFPQLRGLGHSPMAERYALRSLKEAEAYLAHPVLGARLAEVTEAVLALEGRAPCAVFGTPDDLKFRSSMTLFDLASGAPDSPFRRALALCWEGEADERTLALLKMPVSA